MVWSSGLRKANFLPERSSEKGGRWSVLTDHLQNILVEMIDFSAAHFPARTPETAVSCRIGLSILKVASDKPLITIAIFLPSV